jgi:hypothetical protein
MDKMPILAVVLQSIPESFAIVSLSLALIDEKAKVRSLILIATLTALASYFIRLQQIPFGVHSIITIGCLIFFTWIITKNKIIPLLLGLIPALVFYGVLELALVPLTLKLAGLSLNQVLENTWLRIMFPIPLYIICFTVEHLLRKSEWNILGDLKHSL